MHQRRSPATRLAVGLVWAPRPLGLTSRRRSIPLGKLVDLAVIPGVQLFSLAILFGLFTRPVGLVLAIWCIATALIAHSNIAERAQEIQFFWD
jgi:uncharacterized membrane protein YphA (DoxX/SURF4 family)